LEKNIEAIEKQTGGKAKVSQALQAQRQKNRHRSTKM